MRNAAGYTSRGLDVPVPILPPFTHARNVQEQNEMMAGTRRAKPSTLKYVHNYPVVEDAITISLAEQLSLNKYNRLPGQENTAPKDHQRYDKDIQRNDQKHGSMHDTKHASQMLWTGVKTPGWLKYDKKVLRYFAYSTDRVLYSPLEEVRVRKFELLYHMEDQSLEIIEPAVPNSGLPHGKYLQRHKVKLADGSVLKYDSILVGQAVTIYSRSFQVTGCDAATRQFLEQECGMRLVSDMDMPMGQYDATRKAQEEAEARQRLAKSLTRSKMFGKTGGDGDGDDPFEEPRGPGAMFDFFMDRKVQEGLDGKLLRFYCCWDNTKAVFGQKLGFALHYYLKDDTIEIAELHRRNTGRDPFPLLLSRCRLPKTPNIPPVGGRPLSPRSKRNLNIQYYHWSDLKIGAVTKVYGRDLLIYDCDASTKQWLQQQLGARPNDPQLKPIDIDWDGGPKRPPLQVPPNTSGFGSEEDSMRNVVSLIPKKPKGDYAHYMDNWNKVLRFSARMVPVPGAPLIGQFDAERRFIVSFYILDNTLSIFEPKRPNSGMRGGMFLERMRVRKHKQDAWFNEVDFHVGAVVTVYARNFELLDADCYTLKHMETLPDKFPQSDYDQVLHKLKAWLAVHPGNIEYLKSHVMKQDKEGLGYLDKLQLKAALTEAGCGATIQEVITLVRQLGADMEGLTVESLMQALTDDRTALPPPHRDEDVGLDDAGSDGPAMRILHPQDAGRPVQAPPQAWQDNRQEQQYVQPVVHHERDESFSFRNRAQPAHQQDQPMSRNGLEISSNRSSEYGRQEGPGQYQPAQQQQQQQQQQYMTDMYRQRAGSHASAYSQPGSYLPDEGLQQDQPRRMAWGDDGGNNMDQAVQHNMLQQQQRNGLRPELNAAQDRQQRPYQQDGVANGEGGRWCDVRNQGLHRDEHDAPAQHAQHGYAPQQQQVMNGGKDQGPARQQPAVLAPDQDKQAGVSNARAQGVSPAWYQHADAAARAAPAAGVAGHRGSSDMAMLSSKAARPLSAAADVMVRHSQPSLLWQTTNTAAGGIFNPAMTRRK